MNINQDVIQLPTKFKLYWDGKFVGFEKRELGVVPRGKSADLRETERMFLYHSTDGNTWERCFPHPDHSFHRPIAFNEMRQFTGYYDHNGTEIYFGDTLKDRLGNISTVNLINGVVTLCPQEKAMGRFDNSREYEICKKEEV